MIRPFIVSIFLFFFSPSSFAQQRVVIEGQIIDKNTRQAISDVTIVVLGLSGTISNRYGHFSRLVERGKIRLFISHTQYIPRAYDFNLSSDTSIVFEMEEDVQEIEEVEISADQNSFVKNIIPGMVSLEQKDIISQPSVLGIPDVVASLQRGVGIQSVNEGIAGIYVRGGDAGQNFILYDNIELVDPSHLLGTYSAFNPYLIDHVDLYKGNSPVQYANRLSSAIVVSSYDDVSTKPFVTANIGTLASTVAISHQKNKFGFILGGRRTQLEIYKEITAMMVSSAEGFLKKNNYKFYDFNGKVFYNTKKHDQFSLAWYTGGDDLVYGDDPNISVGIDWQNRGTAFTWKHTKPTYALNTIIGFTNYEFAFFGDVMDYIADFDSKYNTVYLKHVFNKSIDNHLLTLSANLHFYEVMPQRSSVADGVNDYTDRDEFRSAEFSLSVADNWQINDKLSIYCGVRFNHFLQFGPSEYNVIDGADTTTFSYKKREVVQQYLTVSPQAFLTWERPNNLSYKFAYSYNAQNVHRGSLATLPLPADLWITSTKLIKPEYAHLLSLGIYKSKDEYNFSAEIYAKLMNNILLFETNLTGELKPNFEENFKAGKGFSTGLELLAQKNTGRLHGWVAYTLSKSRKRIYGINTDEWFDAKYDRIHDLSIVANYKLNKRWDLSTAFVLASGNKATVPAGRYLMMGYIMNDYTAVNSFRMPLYHRLDFSVNYHLEPRFFKASVLNLSIINAYNRKNTYFFFYEVRGNLEEYNISVQAHQFSLFPILPSLSWTIKF